MQKELKISLPEILKKITFLRLIGLMMFLVISLVAVSASLQLRSKALEIPNYGQALVTQAQIVAANKIITNSQSQIAYDSGIMESANEINNESDSDGTTDSTTMGEGEEESFGRNIIPSVLGTVSPFTASVEYGFSVLVPQGLGGLTPSLSIGYSSLSVDDARPSGRLTDVHVKKYIAPMIAGHGFSLSGMGSIIRDTRGDPSYWLKGKGDEKQKHFHRYIVSVPGGVSAEMQYNYETNQWITLPQSFLKIEHRAPERVNITTAQGSTNYKAIDPTEWIITTKDGTRYFFGEPDLGAKINKDGGIARHATPVRHPQSNKLQGFKDGNLYNEFEAVELCKKTNDSDCDGVDKPDLMVSKWLLRKIETIDGKTIDYFYNSHQNSLDYYKDYKKDWDTDLKFVSTTSYPSIISYNDGNHQIRVTTEPRPDTGRHNYMRERIKDLIVETRVSGVYKMVRKYVLNYFDENTKTLENLGAEEIDGTKGVNNDLKLSFLTSITEYGVDESKHLPIISLRYEQPMASTGGNVIYLSTINNGSGGETKFSYLVYDLNAETPFRNFGGKYARSRITKKIVTDKVTNRSFIEEYNYSGAKGYAERHRKRGTEVISGFEFLGYNTVESYKYDFTNDPKVKGDLLAHTKTFFYQSNETGEAGNGCIEPHAAKGQIKEQEVFDTSGKIVTKTFNTYKYRLGTQVFDAQPKCNHGNIKQPYFSYNYDTLTEVTDPSTEPFVEKQIEDKLTQKPISTMRSLTRNLEFNNQGDLLKSVSYGEVDDKGYDVIKTDNRYSHTHYVNNEAKWLLGVPYLSYMSSMEDCIAENEECQWGKSRQYYDNFTGDYTKVDPKDQKPMWGIVSQKESTIVNGVVLVEGYDYLRVSTDPDKPKFGGVTKTYSPLPNSFTARRENICQSSEVTYDDTYHTLVTEKQSIYAKKLSNPPVSSDCNNPRRIKTKYTYDDLGYLLQTPITVSTQTNESPEKYSTSKMEFDSFGRLTKTYLPSVKDGTPMDYPATITRFFERGDQGLVVRSMTLSSLMDGIYQYTTGDSFYDGLGKAYQSQLLQTKIENEDKRKISISEYSANGQVKQTYDIDIKDNVIVENYTPEKPNTIDTPEPLFESSVDKKVVEKNEFDTLGRVIKNIKYNRDNANDTFVTTTQYRINAVKITNPKGIQTLTTADAWGRTVESLTYSPTDNKTMISRNFYDNERPLLEKPIKTQWMSSDSGDKGPVAEFQYDKAGRVIAMKEPSLSNYWVKPSYDVLGNKIGEKAYDAHDKEIPKMTAQYRYDGASRLIYTKYYDKLSAKQSGDSIITQEYDTATNGLGKMAKTTYPTGEDTYQYDGLQRQYKASKKFIDKTMQSQVHFNKISQTEKTIQNKIAEGLVSQIGEISYKYDREGTAIETWVNGKKMVSDAKIDKYGINTETSVTFADTLYKSTQENDGFNRLTNQRVLRNDTSVFSQALHYNQNSELDTLTESMNNGAPLTSTYYYNSFSQLIKAENSQFKTSYDYDLFGRMLKKNEDNNVTFTYSDTFPFFAPKTVNSSLKMQDTDKPINEAISPTLPVFGEDEVRKEVPKVTHKTFPNMRYTNFGALKEDSENCYEYNRNNQLISLSVKKDKNQRCNGLTKSSRILYFYYDAGGTLGLTEEYKPNNLTDPIKKTYLFGAYEEVYE